MKLLLKMTVFIPIYFEGDFAIGQYDEHSGAKTMQDSVLLFAN